VQVIERTPQSIRETSRLYRGIDLLAPSGPIPNCCCKETHSRPAEPLGSNLNKVEAYTVVYPWCVEAECRHSGTKEEAAGGPQFEIASSWHHARQP
jgi:hypothetical protein